LKTGSDFKFTSSPKRSSSPQGGLFLFASPSSGLERRGSAAWISNRPANIFPFLKAPAAASARRPLPAAARPSAAPPDPRGWSPPYRRPGQRSGKEDSPHHPDSRSTGMHRPD